MKASRWILSVALLGIGLRVLLFLFQDNPQGDDGLRYLTESLNLVDHGVFSTDATRMPRTPSAHDLPLYPAIMGVFYWMTNSVGATQIMAGAFNLTLVVGCVFLLCSMLRNKPFCFTDKAIAVSLFVFLFMPESFVYSLFHMPDQLAVFCVVLMLWFYFKGCFLDSKYHVVPFVCVLCSDIRRIASRGASWLFP